MILKPDADGIIKVSFLLLPEYAMVALLSAIEPLRVANRFAKREIFRWQLISESNEVVHASNGLAIQQSIPMHEAENLRNLIVCSSFHPERHLRSETISWLQRQARQGVLLGAMDTGCHLLQAAGLLKNHRITMHWEAIPAFQENYPELEITNELFEIDRNLVTCAGGTAAIDLMLYVIQTAFGHELAIQVCEQFINSGIRQKSDKQRINLAARLELYHPRLLRVIELMESHLEEPIALEELARRACVSTRQLERLFRQHLQQSPAAYYMGLRLQRAQSLLQGSTLSVAEVGLACGFSAAAHFSRTYRKWYGHTPASHRPLHKRDTLGH
ncbi:GlxA family transcriptional regulator [Paenalcaligenes sp. Me131]|uniref:GlxA family transcriptional regulator n=1 Tax=Paenalcaligenes sp. Me131 TaxID=3392636 RepID=UPI003D2934FC